jgi:hypothetical protein
MEAFAVRWIELDGAPQKPQRAGKARRGQALGEVRLR